MLRLRTVIGIMLGSAVLFGSYALSTAAFLSRPQNYLKPSDLGENPVQAAVDYFHAAAADNSVTILKLHCFQTGVNANRVFVRCAVTDSNGHYTLDVELLKTMWRGIDIQQK